MSESTTIPKVSIIVPVYNGMRYLPACVESILRQSHRKIELLLVDDGSNDGSGEFIDSVSKVDDRIRCFHRPNSGPSAARNTGLDSAKGDFIIFIDADDIVEATIVEDLLEAMSGDADFAVCGYESYDGKSRGKFNPYDIRGGSFLSEESLVLCALSGMGGTVWAKMFKADIISKTELRFDLSLRMCEDLLFNIRYALHCRKGVVLKKYLYRHNDYNPDSITKLLDDDNFWIQMVVCGKIEDALINGGWSRQEAEKLSAARCFSLAVGTSLMITARSGQRNIQERICLLKRLLADADPAHLIGKVKLDGIKDRIMAWGMITGNPWLLFGLCRLRLVLQKIIK